MASLLFVLLNTFYSDQQLGFQKRIAHSGVNDPMSHTFPVLDSVRDVT